VCIVRPLKKVGFQKKNGAKPHLRKKQNKIMYQEKVVINKAFESPDDVKNVNIDSERNQSKVVILK
jgi:hypothetical protein